MALKADTLLTEGEAGTDDRLPQTTGDAQRLRVLVEGRTALAPVWGAEASQVEQLWGSAEVLCTDGETDTQPSLPPAQVEFDLGYGWAGGSTSVSGRT